MIKLCENNKKKVRNGNTSIIGEKRGTQRENYVRIAEETPLIGGQKNNLLNTQLGSTTLNRGHLFYPIPPGPPSPGKGGI